MPPRLALILLALLAAVGLLAIWRWSSDARPVAPRSPGSERAAPAAQGGSLALAVPAAAAEPQERAAAGERVDVLAPGAGAPQRPADEPLGLVLHGVIEGPGLDLSLAELSLFERRNGPTQVLSVHPQASGHYELDATELLSTRVFIGSGADFDLVLTHPWCATTRRWLRVASPQPPGTSGGARLGLDSDGAYELVSLRFGANRHQIDFELLESARVHGSVRGTFASINRLVSVGAARPDEPALRGSWIQRGALDGLGNFELRLPPGARYAIVAMALDQRPVTQWIDLPQPGDYSIALTSDAGLAISGRIAVADGLPAPGLGLELFLERADEETDESVWRPSASTFEEVVWTQGAFEWSRRTTRVRADGSFVIDGLAQRDYELRALAVGQPEVELRAIRAARLRAPAEAVELGPILASLSLDLGPAPEGPLHFVLIELGAVNKTPLGPYRTDASGAAQLFLPPRTSFEVQIDGAVVGRVTTGAVGERGLWALAR